MLALTRLAALVIVFAPAGCGFEAMQRFQKKDKDDAETKSLKLAGPVAGAGVELVGRQTSIAEVTAKTCPQRAAKNPGGEPLMWVPDGPARAYVDQQNRVRLIFPHYLTYAFVGSSVEDAQLDCSDAISESAQNPDANMLDDASWPWAFYRLADGRAVTLYHMEYHSWAHPELELCRAGQVGYSWDAGCPWYSAITWGVAQDGIHFTRPPAPSHVAARALAEGYPKTTTGLGPSDHSGIMRHPVDGKYYVTFMARGLTDQGMCVMRTDDLAKPDGWTILTATGWDGDANRGVANCRGVIAGSQNAAPGSLSWSTVYGRPIQVAFAHPEGREQGFYMYLGSDDLTTWEGPVLVMQAKLPWGTNGAIPNAATHAYPSFLPLTADATGNFDQLGEEAWLFFIRTFNNDPTARRSIERVRVRFKRDGGERANTAAPAKGLYRVGGSGLYSNGTGNYCEIRSMEQLRGCGWTESFDRLPEYGNSSNYQNDGLCQCGLGEAGLQANGQLAKGCYRIGPTGFYSNGQGASCAFLFEQMQGICGTGDFQALREMPNHGANREDPACGSQAASAATPATPATPAATPAIPAATPPPKLSQGCYKIGPTGFYSNGAGRSCPFLWDQMPGICGHQDFGALNALENHGGNVVDPQCSG